MPAVALDDVAHARVVVVDDNLPSLQLVQVLLSRAGMQSVAALSDPRDFLARYELLAPELVILDLHMPGLDGYTVLTELRRRASAADLPVLVLTADTTRDATHRALGIGASDFLSKPLDATELLLRVRNLLQARALHVGLQRRQSWLAASGQLARDLLADNCVDPLRRVCELAREAADADIAAVAVPAGDAEDTSDAEVDIPVWVGDRSDAADRAVAAAFASRTLATDVPRTLDDLVEGAEEVAPGAPGPTMLVPLLGTDRLLGALLLCRRFGRPGFGETDLQLAFSFAGQAAVAVEFAKARADQERMLVLADRHRIARDLHDQVIQRLFATGLRMQQLASRLEPGPVAERLDEHVGELDDTISEIRSTIFGLRQQLTSTQAPLSDRLRELVGELTEVLGFAPELRIEGSLEAMPAELGEDLVAAVREALTNIAKHAGARHADVLLLDSGTTIVLQVQDDGVGVRDDIRRSGLANLAERAARHGGACTVEPAVGGGTRIEWTARVERRAENESVVDDDDAHRTVREELVRSGVSARQAASRDPLDLHRDV